MCKSKLPTNQKFLLAKSPNPQLFLFHPCYMMVGGRIQSEGEVGTNSTNAGKKKIAYLSPRADAVSHISPRSTVYRGQPEIPVSSTLSHPII